MTKMSEKKSTMKSKQKDPLSNTAKQSPTDPVVGSLSKPKRLSFKNSRFSTVQLMFFSLVFGLIGGFLLYKTFAAAPLVARVEAETLVMPSWGAFVQNSSVSSAGKAMVIYGNRTVSGQFTNTIDSVSVAVDARSTICEGEGGFITVKVDNQEVFSGIFNSTTYKTLGTATVIKAGKHSISITFSNDYYKKGICDRNIGIDKVDFLGPVSLPSSKPTVTLTATPTSLVTGLASTLKWTSTNSTNCAASGAWSGNKSVSGSLSTAALTANSTYSLTCTGNGGTATASTTVTISTPSLSGAFAGTYYNSTNFTDLKLSRNDAKVDFDWAGGSPAADIKTDGFSARWVGDFKFDAANYDFTATADDGVRLYIDNALVLEKWFRQFPTTYAVTRAMSAGTHNIKVEYYEEVGGASIKAGWAKKSPVATTPTPPAPPVAPTPPPPTPSPTPPPSGSSGLQYGAVAGGDESLGLTTAQNAGIGLVRSHDKSYNVSPTSLDGLFLNAAQKKIELVLLVGFDSAPPDGGTMGDVAARFGPSGSFWQSGQPGAGLGQYAMRYIEWGNENSYSYGGKPGGGGGTAYANSFRSLYDRVQAKNSRVRLLAQGEDGGSGSTQWMDTMFAAQPSMKTMAGCWVVHPYGPGTGKMDRMVTSLASKGVSTNVPVCITEDGLATDNGRCLNDNYGWNKCMTYDQAATSIKDKINTVLSRSYGSRVSMYLLYKGNDNKAPGATSEREDYFGYRTVSGGTKGNFTTAIGDLARSYPPRR
jgi:PA14 domain/Ca-dependent carbohydrate-binding module xylan-binding